MGNGNGTRRVSKCSNTCRSPFFPAGKFKKILSSSKLICLQGTDLSPIQPTDVYDNVHFFIDDASEEDWAVEPASYDYIHTRVLLGSFGDFRDIIRKSFYYTKPGGYMESQEIFPTPFCDDGTMPDDWPFLEWSKYFDQAASKHP